MRWKNTPRPRRILMARMFLPSRHRENVYRAICEYAQAHAGNSPTVREMMEMAGVSSASVVAYNVKQLIDMGRLAVVDRKLVVVGATWTPPHEESRE